ncbi:hypothetical protein C8F01DRAFT_1248139 [Mycena amicta]|nr:hypothetical protein C8F01DRAFT_1248139 [Mycena amicta]
MSTKDHATSKPILSPTKGRKDNPIGDADVERLSVPVQKCRKSSQERSCWQDEVEIVSQKFSVQSEHKHVCLAPNDSRVREHVAFRQELEVDVAESRARTHNLQGTLQRLQNLRKPQQLPLPVPEPTAVELAGLRHFPDGFPTQASLYWSDVRPQPLPEVLPIHKCTLCEKVKLRPVCISNASLPPYCISFTNPTLSYASSSSWTPRSTTTQRAASRDGRRTQRYTPTYLVPSLESASEEDGESEDAEDTNNGEKPRRVRNGKLLLTPPAMPPKHSPAESGTESR